MSASYQYQVGDETKTVQIERRQAELVVTIGTTTYHVIARQDPAGRLDLTIDGQRLQAYTAHADNHHLVWLMGKSWQLQSPKAGLPTTFASPVNSGSLITTMPGLVTAILVAEGDRVQRGDTLVLLEAMKMEQRITAPHDGRVSRIGCAVGEVAAQGALLVQISPL